MDTNPKDMNSDDFNFDEQNPSEGNTKPDPGDGNSGEKNANLAITIVVVVGILLAAILLFRTPAEDKSSPTPGPGTPQIIQPMATPPTQAAQVQPTQPPQIQPTVPSVPANPIQNINWQWVSVTDSSTGQTTTVPNPQQYTIVFTADGYVNGNADCNSYTGTYSQGGGLTITVTTMTRAACPDGSLDQQYIQLLGSVAAGGLDGSGNLALETAGGAQRMLFQNGGPAQ